MKALRGLRIIALFDADLAKLGAPPDGRQILPVAALIDLVSRLQVQIGIIAVPEQAEQDVAERPRGGRRAGHLELRPV